ncbi:MAG TPA: manganese efflux pump MntP family protein [Spirochaetota bacterium]|nr:manganese efflux pump MntP family protein [Spirochaetota bacterium]HRZ26714.1 manganese efflux pump MntP family protein [Spirochaetota bacterium]HSA13477.1 manganese efflux pump MntP family protein [Spirochaetota bacterium]
MDYYSIIIIAVALAMDAFSVSISAGAAIGNPGPRHYFRLAFHFGLFQFMMPVIGYLGGMYLEGFIRDFDHWIAGALLWIIGGKMLKESFGSDEKKFETDPSRGISLIMLSVATSIDALAVGISIGVLNNPILVPSVIIGIVCSIFSAVGVALGKKAADIFGKKAEAVGGVMLIIIGIKILFEHLTG